MKFGLKYLFQKTPIALKRLAYACLTISGGISTFGFLGHNKALGIIAAVAGFAGHIILNCFGLEPQQCNPNDISHINERPNGQ